MTTFTEFAEGKEMIEKADAFAEKKHAGQKRKFTGEPYIVHPRAVAEVVEEYGGDSNEIAAALLHDTLEDTDTEYEELEQEFNRDVAQYVLELTHDIKDKSKKGEILADKMNHMSTGALLIKLADRLKNVSDFDTADPKFVARYKPETEYILDNLKTPHLKEPHRRLVDAIRKAIEPF